MAAVNAHVYNAFAFGASLWFVGGASPPGEGAENRRLNRVLRKWRPFRSAFVPAVIWPGGRTLGVLSFAVCAIVQKDDCNHSASWSCVLDANIARQASIRL